MDSADAEKVPEARENLHDLLSKPSLAGIPLLVLGSKNDLPGCLTAEQLIDELWVLTEPSHPTFLSSICGFQQEITRDPG